MRAAVMKAANSTIQNCDGCTPTGIATEHLMRMLLSMISELTSFTAQVQREGIT